MTVPIPETMVTPSIPWQRHWLTALLLGMAIIVAWQVPWLSAVVYPFRLFGTFVHELCHGLTAIATGGNFQRFEVQTDLSGVAWSAGGVRVLVASAGYVGSAIAGGVFILLYQRLLSSRALLYAIGGLLAVLCLLFVRNLFGIASGLTLSALFIAAGWKLPPSWRDLLLMTLALQLILDGYNSLFTVLSLSTGSATHTDAHTMAQLTFVPASVWVVIWMALSSVVLIHALRWSYRRNAKKTPMNVTSSG